MTSAREWNDRGVAALNTGRAAEATAAFAQATALDPDAGPLWLNLAKAHRLAANDAGEHAALTRALAIDQLDFMAQVRKAELHQRRGEDADAHQHWSAVVQLGAQMPPGPALEAVIARAREFVSRRTQSLADAVEAELGPAIADADSLTRRRISAAVDHALGRRSLYINQCAGLHYPFLPADEYFDRAHFPWLAALEAEVPAIRSEWEILIRERDPGFVPYVSLAPGTPENPWSALSDSFDWSALYLWKYGEPQHAILEACPRTRAALEAVPGMSIPGRGPTVFFSLLKPGARIPPHTGVSNIRTIGHLALSIPPGCGFRVGGETREWREGEGWLFDDTIEHEAWNDSDRPRAILIFDVWNPYLTAPERDLVSRYFATADAAGHGVAAFD
ncbi:Aspartyl/asparaginy/proline hydroxylase domain-containing protein [Sphingomonas antarctica]|uniref:aspartyl/asparaginyl beta-hydroxylase domain-containing protein n=1 Tax=Sphingomonas antarctica TaxID=2040274 RepID=UPI0039E7D5A8